MTDPTLSPPPQTLLPQTSTPPLSESAMLVLMAATAAAAAGGRWFQPWLAHVMGPDSTPLLAGLLVVVGSAGCLMAVALRRPRVVVLAVAVVALGRGAHAEARYEPVATGSHGGWVTLVTDPEPGRFGTNAEVSLDDGTRVQLGAGWEHTRIGSFTAGTTVYVEGTLRSIDESDWARSRHLAGRLSLDELGASRGVSWWRLPSEWMRGAVQAGADRLPYEWQPLYTGLVIGDDRFQSKGQQARFRAVGLSHLLAVSGQNVAFVMAVAAPLLERLRWWPRLISRAGLLIVFALATRMEPSVLRATATAGASVWAVTSGARASGVRALSIAVSALMVIDPFLVWSVGFRLSVAASLGILVIGPVLDDRLPGSETRFSSWWRTPLTVTLGAQIGVTPLLASVFGPVALVSVPANLLAGWAAGFVMTWGLTGGLVAAVVGPTVGRFVQLPAQWAMAWIDGVARVAMIVPSPMIGGAASVFAVGIAVLGWVAAPRSRGATAVAGLAAAALLLTTVPMPPRGPVELAGGARHWPATASVLVIPASADERLIDSVVERRLASVDVVVVESGGRTMSDLVVALRDVMRVGVVLAPPQHRVVGGRRLLAPMTLVVEGARLEVRPLSDDRLEVVVLDTGADPDP